MVAVGKPELFNLNAYLNSLDEWYGQWAMQFSATKIVVRAYNCLFFYPRRVFISGLSILTTQFVMDLDYNTSPDSTSTTKRLAES